MREQDQPLFQNRQFLFEPVPPQSLFKGAVGIADVEDPSFFGRWETEEMERPHMATDGLFFELIQSKIPCRILRGVFRMEVRVVFGMGLDVPIVKEIIVEQSGSCKAF